jgi:hypothetical protein
MIAEAPAASGRASWRVGAVAAAIVTSIYLVLALAVRLPAAAGGFYSDEATYYLMAQSLAHDGDFAYRKADLDRVWPEFPSGPSGVFLKRGRDITGVTLTSRPPFVALQTVPDRDSSRLFFGKSFIYPLCAAPFVKLFGTNGFLVFNGLLLGLGFCAAFQFIGARSATGPALLVSSAFLLATVVPVYVVWMMPELFNCVLGLLAYFCWLYKEVAPRRAPARGAGWLQSRASDYMAAALLGLATFSKVTNALLLLPMVGWWLWRRRWRRAVLASLVFAAVTGGLFAANIAISGDWNYQGGERGTFYGTYPFESPGVGFAAGAERARDASLVGVMFDRQVFWTNLRANLEYVVVGRYSGLLPYFCPALIAMAAFLLARRRRAAWQWFILAGLLVHIVAFIITQPYTYFGGGGTVGNRYFMGAYGMALFLFPPVRSMATGLIAWVIGAVFTAGIVLHPFASSLKPADPAKRGPLRLLPVELTNVNSLPINTERQRVMVWYGHVTDTDPGFQIYHLDDNGYLPEADKRSFWVKGRARAEMLIKTDRPYGHLQVHLTSGAAPTTVDVGVNGHAQTVTLGANQDADVRLPLGPGFPYKMDRDLPAYVWVLSIRSSGGFQPPAFGPHADPRYLGVLVRPMILP